MSRRGRGPTGRLQHLVRPHVPEQIVVAAALVGELGEVLGHLEPGAGARVHVLGRPLEVGRSLSYKGMMLADVPNLVMAFGYTNASWTLKADLTAGYVCRLLRYMDRHGYTMAVPRRDQSVPSQPFLGFTSGYVQRAVAILPKQGTRRPWQVYQSYLADLATIRWGRIADGIMHFETPAAQT